MDDLRGPCRELDVLLTRLCASVPSVHLLPGPADPANFTMPQQPIQACITPMAASYSSFHSCTNPAYISLDGGGVGSLTFLLTSGQNVSDALSNVSGASPLDVVRQFLHWRHICPTAPDTLPCYPHQSEDPFVLEHSPHVLVVGNQPFYDTALVHGKQGQVCRTIALPSFAHTGCAVLMDIHSPELHTEPIQFTVHRKRRRL